MAKAKRLGAPLPAGPESQIQVQEWIHSVRVTSAAPPPATVFDGPACKMRLSSYSKVFFLASREKAGGISLQCRCCQRRPPKNRYRHFGHHHHFAVLGSVVSCTVRCFVGVPSLPSRRHPSATRCVRLHYSPYRCQAVLHVHPRSRSSLIGRISSKHVDVYGWTDGSRNAR